MNKGEIKLMGKKLNYSSTLINLYSNFQYIQCPTKKWENDWKSSFKIIGFCDLPKWEVYTDG